MHQELKPLPISSSDITTILTNNFLYVDKTKFVYDMIKVPSKYFLSRPRRFGKSTLLSTLNEVFLGKKNYLKTNGFIIAVGIGKNIQLFVLILMWLRMKI